MLEELIRLVNRRYRKKLQLVKNRIYQLSDKKDYGVCPSPISDRDFANEIKRYFLGSDWYVTMPISHEQVNHEALIQIEMQYKGCKQKNGK